MRGAGGAVLAAGAVEVFRRISRKALSGIEEESVLPDVDPRKLATAGEETAEGSGMGEGDRAGQARKAGQAELRLCNLVAQSPADAQGGLQEGGGEGTNGAANRALGDRLLQTVPKPNAGHRESDRNSGADAGKRSIPRLLLGNDLRGLFGRSQP